MIGFLIIPRAYKGFFLGGVQNFRGGGTAILGGVFGAREARAIFLPPPKKSVPRGTDFLGGVFYKKIFTL